MHRYVVLGSGRQGTAIAYDLARNGRAASVVLADGDADVADAALRRLQALLADCTCALSAAQCDVSNRKQVTDLLASADVAVSAVPYRFNVALTDAAIAAECSLCDLGGNTAIVREQLERHEAARDAGVSIVPDCGLAPGLGNHLAAHGVASLDEPRHVHVRCGGLPQERVGPLNYKLLFNFQGLINEYSGCGQFLRGGKLVEIPALTECEEITFPEPLGTCEAAVTSGGTSTCPHTFAGKLQSYDYKTVRYPGHFAIVRAMFELGCFDERITLGDGREIMPKALLRDLMEDRLAYPNVRDLVVLRVTVAGVHDGQNAEIQYDLLDRHDERTGFTAMERTTGFPTALVALMQARGDVPPGARPLEIAVPADAFFDQLAEHDIHVQRR